MNKIHPSFASLILFLAAIVSFIIAAAATPDPVVRSFTVNTNPTNYLAASSVRLTPGSWSIDKTNGKPILECTIEAWGDDVDNGVTNKSVIRRQQFTLTTFQLNNWNTQPGTNSWAWLENVMLSKSKLTKKQ